MSCLLGSHLRAVEVDTPLRLPLHGSALTFLYRMSSRAVRALYRLCLKKAQELQQCGLQLEFRRAIDKQVSAIG